MEGAYGAQIVQVSGEHAYELNEELLEEVLLKPEIRDLPVVVVSVVGAYRGGKSFLLNFFIRYLAYSKSSRLDGTWLGEDGDPLLGFDWRGGSQRATSGILLWSEPFITRLRTGEKAVVLLMDTQGTFDSTSTFRDNSTVFALSTLMSSVQIYNLSRNIQENDLQYLELFTSYGKIVHEKHHAGKPFQTLEFLVRDWPYPEDYGFGAAGGQRLLQERLEIHPDQASELQELRSNIRSCFESVRCYLMPHPGLKVRDPTFKGQINDIDPEFKFHLKQLIPSLLNSDKLLPKIINGQRVTAADFYHYLKAYMTIFNSDEIPTSRSIVQVTAEASLLSAVKKSRNVYENGMNSECGPDKPALPTVVITELHHKYLNAAKTAFTKQRTMANQEDIDKNYEKLTEELNDQLPQFEKSNLSKLNAVLEQAIEVFEEKILNARRHQTLCLHPTVLENVHKEASKAAMDYYDGHVKNMKSKPDDKKSELEHYLSSRFVQLKVTNDINNKDIVNELKEKYWQYMDTQASDPPLSDADFKLAHETGLTHATNGLLARRNIYMTYPSDIFVDELVELINYVFVRLETINHSKIEQLKTKQLLEQRRIEQEQINAQLEQSREEQQRKEFDLEQQRVNLEIERLKIESRRLEMERIRVERENAEHRHRGSGLFGVITNVATAVLSRYLPL